MSNLDYANLPFEEQINFFLKKLNLPTDSYLDLQGQDHDYAFVVAGANRNEIIADFRKAVDKAINDGTTLAEFRKDFDEIVKKHGWDYNGGRNWRSRIIYDTNLYSSYQVGRYQQQMRIKHLRPYWQYQHRDGQKHPRPLHQSWNNLVLKYDDPFWQTHYPINAYGCKCSVIAHSKSSLKREGLVISDSPQIEYETKTIGANSGNPQEVTLPKGVDYGFDRVAGTHKFDLASKLLLDKAISVPPKLASNLVNHVLQVPEVEKLLLESHKQWVDDIASGEIERLKKADNIRTMAVLNISVLESLETLNLAPQSAVIAMDKGRVIHAIREVKQENKIAVPLEFWQQLPKHLQNPKAILLDTEKSKNVLLFIYEREDDSLKIVVTMDYLTKADKQPITLNMVTTGSLLSNISSLGRYQLIYGSL